MPTTVQQVESLPEGLVTLEQVNPKVPLIEPVVEKEAEKEKPTEEVTPKTEVAEPVKEEAAPIDVAETTTAAAPAVADMTTTNVEMFETPKHVINCSEKFDKVTIDVNIMKEKLIPHQRCYILTVHDIGFDNTQFEEFINSKEMSQLRNRTVWINVTLPGQEIEANDMIVQKYPTISELADELVNVLDHFNLGQVVLLGEGVGATICAHFAMRHPSRCYGLMCVEPVVSAASYMESLKYKLQNFSFSRQNSSSKQDKKDPACENMVPEATNENESFHLAPMDNTTHEKFKNRNIKNINLFTEAFLNRPNLCENISKLECDTLIASNKSSSSYTESKRLFRAICDSYRKNCRSLVNVPFIEVENKTGRILEKSTEQFTTSLQYFLQGIGLLSAMPLRQSLLRQASKTSEADETLKTETPAVAEAPASQPLADITPVPAEATETTEKKE